MSKERLIAFIDAVLAIIMTIRAFIDLRWNYFAYALSFFWLGSL